MTLAPLLAASPVIQLHAFAAMAAFALGIVQLSAPKGTLPHRTIGWVWVLLMLAISISAFKSGCGDRGARSTSWRFSP